MTKTDIWLGAVRPKTLPASIAPVVLASAWAWYTGAFHFIAAVICLFFALLIQIGTNFANDYYDGIKGTDTEERAGPTRAVASGLVAPATMLAATLVVLSCAFVVGLGLVFYGGWWLIVVGVVCVLLAIAYTGGPYPLAYNGLGDVFVVLFFGLVAVMLSFYVQSGYFAWQTFWLGLGMGLLTNNILVVNNYRDVDEDRVAGKRTLVVRFGRKAARWQYGMSIFIALLVPVLFAIFYGLPWYLMLLVPIVIGHFAWRHFLALGRIREKTAFNPLLAKTALLVVGYALLFSLMIVLSR